MSIIKGTVSRDFPAQTAYIIHLQIPSLFMDKKDFASFCKLAEIFALLSHSELSGTALSARDVNDHTSSSIIKLRYRIVAIAKRNENVQK